MRRSRFDRARSAYAAALGTVAPPAQVDLSPVSIKSGEKLKAAGQAKACKVWLGQALAELRDFVKVRKMYHGSAPITMDGFRWARDWAIPAPPHVNAWGALPRAAVKEGLITPTGKMVKAQRPEAHARMVKEYVPA